MGIISVHHRSCLSVMFCLEMFICLFCFHDAFRDDIVIWAQKKTSTPVIRISSVAEAEKFLTKYQTFLIGRFENFEVSYDLRYAGVIRLEVPN